MSSSVVQSRSLPVASALVRYRLLKQDSSGNWAYAGAGDIAEGINDTEVDATMAAATPTYVVEALLPRVGLTKKLMASEAIAAGADVYTAANGKISGQTTGPTGFKVGVCREAATADGDVIEVELRPDYAVWFAKIAAVSTSITGTAADTAYDKTIAIPAGLLRAGSRGKIHAKVNIPTTTGAETLVFKVKLADGVNTVTLAVTIAVDVADADVAVIDIAFELPTATTIVSSGFAGVGVLGTATARPVGVLSSTYAPTSAGTISITQTASSTGETSALQVLAVEIRR